MKPVVIEVFDDQERWWCPYCDASVDWWEIEKESKIIVCSECGEVMKR